MFSKIDGKFKTEFETSEAAMKAALELKKKYPPIQVNVYDAREHTRTLVAQLRNPLFQLVLPRVRFYLFDESSTPLAMWGRLPGVAASPGWAVPLHRWSGVVAFVLTLPVAFQCIWSAGFSNESPRTLIHSLAGCLFYGAFAAKMLSLRLRGLPGWVLPVLGGLLAVLLTVIWFSSAFWYFTRPGVPKF